MRKFSTLFIFSVLTLVGHSQDCRIQGAVDVFHANQIKANVLQRGQAFWDYDDAAFQVPFSGPNSPNSIFNSALWLGGKDTQGDVRVIAQQYGRSLNCGFMPGPLMDDMPLGEADVENWNRNFQVTRFEIEQHILDAADGQVDDPIENVFGWPAAGNEYFESIHGFTLDLGPQGGAGFIEVDGHRNDKYEPQFGEYPHVRGLSELATPSLINWNVYNSAQDQIELNDGDPLICEIQETTYAFNCNEDNDEADLLNHSLFQQFVLTSLSKDEFEGIKLGIWVDPDLGCYTDDHIGSSPENNTVYWYNKDNEDGTVGVECNQGVLSYGVNPPAMGLTFLNQEMSSMMYYDNSSIVDPGPPPTADPLTALEYYQYLDATWRDGTHLTKGGTGYNVGSTDTVRHAFSDLPTDSTGWSMHTVGLGDGDYRFIASADVADFSNGQTWILDLVYHYNRVEGNDHLGNAVEAIERAQWFNDGLLEGCAQWTECDCDCVWPADTDQDGVVNYKDAANIIFGLGATGDTRMDPLPFAPRDVENWGVPLIEGLDAKFADVDGNGVISEDDFELFQLYLGQSNACRIENPVECPEGPEVYFDFNKTDSLFSEGLNRGKIRLRSNREFVGVSYEVQVDESIQQLVLMSPRLNWKDTVLRNLVFEHRMHETNVTRYQGIVMNTDKKNHALSGASDNSVGNLVLIHQELPKAYPQNFVEIKICDFTVYYEDGTKELLPATSHRYYLPDSVVVTNVQRLNENQIEVFPNPASNSVQIVGLDAPSFEYEWRSLDGRLVNSGVAQRFEEISFYNDRKGVYLLKIVAANKTYFQKVVFR